MDTARQRALRYLSKSEEQAAYNRADGHLDRYIDIICNESTGGRCPHCQANAVTVELRQLRSADEGMTALATCGACGKRWTVH